MREMQWRCLAIVASLMVLLSLNGCGSGGQPPAAFCGNGIVDVGEECDGTPGCTDRCTKASVCGNGMREGDEQCDDGNTQGGDGCSATCQNEMSPPGCGDGHTDPGEQCDDGNTQNGDGCSATCQKEAGPSCGDGKVDPGEDCDDGNKTPDDGCENNCTKTAPKEITCQNLPPIAQGTCEVTPGDNARLILGTVLAPGMIYRGGQVLVDAKGTIVNVGCDCAKAPDPAACMSLAATATKITCPTGVVSPALINTHDHITYAQNSPYTDTGERYEHRHDWREGKNGHTKIPAPGGASKDQVTWGELRFLMGGAASTVGSGSAPGLLRNLDKAADELGLGQPAVDFQTFPLGDSNGTQLASGCAYPKIITSASIAGEDAFFPHVAEGINAFAENEFRCMSSAMNGGQDLVQPQSAFIHSVGLEVADYADMAAKGTSLIWSPRSNITLYGNTAVVTMAARLGTLIALGTDWMPTGSMNMLRELQCADSFNAKYLDGYFSDQQLWRMVTANAAAATATDDVLGALAPGKVGDISIFEGKAHKDFRAIIDAQPEDVALVLRSGKVLYGEAATVAGVGGSGACDAIDVCGSMKQVCLQGEIGKGYAALKTSVGNIYPAFFCGGPPMNEPSCTPKRPKSVMGSTVYDGVASATDADGDGIPDAMDNCPHVFNPVRPVDNGAQPDTDGDGVGDACDICPLDANTTMCKVFDPNDTDGDGTPNATDNCPNLSNPGQEDADKDGKGDVCDPCPMVANPGNAACPATIYDIKKGTVPVGAAVAIDNALVTGRFKSGFFLQVKPGDPGYMGSDYSGVYVFDSSNTVKVGDRVSITTATVTNYFGQIQLDGPSTKINMSAGEAPPAPTLATTAEIATGGARAKQLESVIVTVSNPQVPNEPPPTPDPSDSTPNNEFFANDGSGDVRVNDLLYLASPLPVAGETFTSISGILDYRNNDSKIEPRGPSDFTGGQAHLSKFEPALSFAYVGQSGAPTAPTPLTVTLTSAPAMDTFVPISSGDPMSLTVTGGGVTIPAGQTSAPVLVDGVAQSAKVTLTATLGVASLTADVRVLDPAELPKIASLTPPAATVPPGGTTQFTVALDIPAPAGGAVVDVALNPANAGVAPAMVTVPAGQLSATFSYVDASVVQSATVTATLGMSMAQSTINVVVSSGHLIINEIDYDQIGTDNDEFIELYNGTGAPIDLTGYALVFVNGADNMAYLTVDLSPAGTLADQQYLVVGSSTVMVPASALKINFVAASNNIQNGAPDAVALVDTSTNMLVDALSYEGSMTMANVPPLGVVSLVEGTPLPANVADSNTVAGSICRLPNGQDTDNAASDWAFSGTPTPGATNIP